MIDAICLVLGLLLGAAVTLIAVRGRASSELVQAEAALAHERELGAERLATLREAEQRLSDSFKAMSAEALQANMVQLTELAKAQLRTAQVEGKGDLEKRANAVEQMVAPLREQLGRVDAQLTALNKERHESRGRLESQLRSMTETQDKLRTETGALVTALRKPNARGQWGQMQLRKVVELAGMVRHCDFTEQSSFDGDERTLRPDMVINMPGGKHVVVDSKAPLQGILDAYEARDEEERLGYLQAHARLLRKHVKQLADKAYWTGLDSTPEFVVLFLPGEHLYSAALEADPELMDDAMARHVLIATPTTLLALLHSVAYGWQQEKVAESAMAISELGRELHGRLVKLSSLIGTLGKRLNSTVEAFNDTVGSYETRVLPGARRFADHGAVAEAREIPEITPITVNARTARISAPEDHRAAVAADLGDEPPALFDDAPRRLRPAS
jgi:DNA recombination protein RmuC